MAGYKQKMGIEEDPEDSAYWREKEARRMNKPDAYDSVRPSGTRARLRAEKSEALKDAALGVAIAPVGVALETALGRSGGSNKGPIGAGADHLAGTVDRFSKSAGDAADFIGGSVNKYKRASDEESAIERELKNQDRRESRGMKKGGKVKTDAPKPSVKGWGKARGARAAKYY